MFWCVVSLYIFTRLYFDSPYGLAKIRQRARQNTAQLVKIYSDTTHQNS